MGLICLYSCKKVIIEFLLFNGLPSQTSCCAVPWETLSSLSLWRLTVELIIKFPHPLGNFTYRPQATDHEMIPLGGGGFWRGAWGLLAIVETTILLRTALFLVPHFPYISRWKSEILRTRLLLVGEAVLLPQADWKHEAFRVECSERVLAAWAVETLSNHTFAHAHPSHY